MMKTVRREITEPTLEKAPKVVKRKSSSLLAEGIPRKASAASNSSEKTKQRKQSIPRKSISETEQIKREKTFTISLEQRKPLRKSKTTVVKSRASTSSVSDGPKLMTEPKNLLTLKREVASMLGAKKLSTSSQAEKNKLVSHSTKKHSWVNEKPKGNEAEEIEKPASLLKVVRSDDVKKVAQPFMSQELHEERMAALRQIVNQAELDQRIFCMFDRRRHVTKPIREELFKRGWEELQPEKGTVLRKNRSSPSKITSTSTAIGKDTVVQNPAGIDRTEKAIFQPSGGENATAIHVSAPDETEMPLKENKDILDYGTTWEMVLSSNKQKKNLGGSFRSPAESKFISNYIEENNLQVTMVVLSSKPELQLSYFPYVPKIVNKFQKTSFCTKSFCPQYGLWLNLKNKFANLKHLKYPVQTPRMYNLGDRQSYQNFAFDFYTTITASVLRWLVFKLTDDGITSVSAKNGKVPTSVFKFALKKAKLFINYLNTGSTVTRDEVMRSESNWQNLLLWFYKLVNEQEKMEIVSTTALYILHSQAVEVLRTLRQIKPESVNDGMMNLWIVKPYSSSCGRGIFITNNFYYLQQLEQKRYIIQKYIERPYLISGTKFDIRQWFMVTSLSPLQIWIYKECYLRFCSAPFNLQNLHESLHLTNNAIQKKYAKFVGLPCQNMWDSNTFRRFLRETGNPTLWEDRIYPGMRDALIATLLCSESTFDTTDAKFPPRNGWFEIYGADFMLTRDLREGPWLIEINENPALDPSTPVTANLCPKMLRDVVKVAVDWRNDPKADTGEWELAFSGKEEK